MSRSLRACKRGSGTGLLFLFLFLLGVACGPPAEGPGEIVYSRDVCERCQMVISDRRSAAQIRDAQDRHLHVFDDLGCALLWQDEEQGVGGGADELWVASPSGESWLNGVEARYTDGQPTPMNYGVLATGGPESSGELSLDEVRQRIIKRERERRSTRN